MNTLVVVGYEDPFNLKSSLSHENEQKLQAALSAAKS